MDSELLTEAFDYLEEQDGFSIHSLLIARNGYVVTDAYFYPFAQGSLHDLASVTKSFISSLIGIAIEKEYIDSVQQTVLDLFPDRSVANVDANKEAMTVQDLLAMSSGIECINEPAVGELTLRQMRESPDWAQFTLDLPVTEVPGTSWVYCSPNPHLLSAIIQETTGMSALDFAQEHLFAPLGVSDVIWPSDPQGNNNGWGDLAMAPHDMAKLGYLYLHQGVWDGQQVLSADWVEAATSPVSSFPPDFPVAEGYGYLWWLNDSDSYYADGQDGQRVFVFPDLDMVVVTTGGGGRNQYSVLETLLTSYILPAAESAAPLPSNPDGVAALEAKIQAAASSVRVQPEPVPPLSEIAQRVARQTFVMDPNPAGLQSVSLAFPQEAEAVFVLSFVDGNQIEWLIGLDNVYRTFPGANGLLEGAKGRWESDNVLVVHHDAIGDNSREQISATFEEDRMTVQIQDLNRPDAVLTLVGRLEE